MKLLIIAATKFEIAPLLKCMETCVERAENKFVCTYKDHSIDLVLTGVGMVATAYHTSKALSQKYDLAINAGICGSFNKNFELGEVVNIYEDCFSELGAQDGERFLSLNELQLPGIQTVNNVSNSVSTKTIDVLPKVTGITVNTTHGNEADIEKVFSKFHPYVESMEGAAFMFVCEQEKVRNIQIRGISNYVEKRNKEQWNIPLAIEQLNKKLQSILDELK